MGLRHLSVRTWQPHEQCYMTDPVFFFFFFFLQNMLFIVRSFIFVFFVFFGPYLTIVMTCTCIFISELTMN